MRQKCFAFIWCCLAVACGSRDADRSKDAVIQHVAQPRDTVAKHTEIVSSYNISDSIGYYFKAEGVVSLLTSEKYLEEGFELLNDDGSIFMLIKPAADKVVVNQVPLDLTKAVNEETLKDKYQFKPYSFYPDHTIYKFEYVKADNNTVVVYVNKEKNIVKKIKGTAAFEVEPWSKHLTGSMIGFDAESNPVRDSPSESATAIKGADDQDIVWIVNKVEGEWMKIECSDICDFPCTGKTKTGWIKWRSGMEILISIYYAC